MREDPPLPLPAPAATGPVVGGVPSVLGGVGGGVSGVGGGIDGKHTMQQQSGAMHQR